MIKNEFFFPSTSALADIHAASYLPENKEDVKIVLQIAHGMAEHLERYEAFAEYLTANGIAVYINDHIGHGKSITSRDELGYFGEKDGWKHFVEDCHELTKIAKNENPGKPYIFFGHSMGSFVARAYAFKYANEIDGVVVCGTSGKNPLASVGIVLAKIIAKIFGSHHRSKLIDKMSFGTYNERFEKRTNFDWLTRDNDIVDKYIADEDCGFLFTATGSKDLMCILDYVSSEQWYHGFNKDLPVYVIAGEEDPVGAYGKGVKEVADGLRANGVKDVTLTLYPGCRHEILNESQAFETVAKGVVDFAYRVCKL